MELKPCPFCGEYLVNGTGGLTMIECVLAWTCLFISISEKNPLWAIASAAFAVAAQISRKGD